MKHELKNNQKGMKLTYYLKNKSEFEDIILRYDELVEKIGIDKIMNIIQTPKHIIEDIAIVEKTAKKKRGPKPKIKELKIYKSFWAQIVGGQKKFEYRKLEKGIDSGEYVFIDAETNEQLGLVKLIAVELYPTHAHQNTLLGTETLKDDREFIKANYKDKHDYVQYQIIEKVEF